MVFSLEQVVKGAGEVQATNLWDLKLELNSGLGISIPDDYMFRCESIGSLPGQEMAKKEYTLSNFNLTQPGQISRKGEMEISFVEGIDAIGTNFLQELSNAYCKMNESDAERASVGWDNIRSTAYIWLLDSKMNRTRGFKLMHCIIEPKWPGDGLQASDEVLKTSINITYNWWSYLKQ